MNPVGIVRDLSFLEHRPAPGHPDQPARLEALFELVERPEWSRRLVQVPARVATAAELGRVHARDYLAGLAATAGHELTRLDADTQVSGGSWQAARSAAGGVCGAVDLVLRGEPAVLFALVRPPGHHALAGRAMGFCLLNNVAVAAAHARAVHGLERILIVDWDAHHGNGTQAAFDADPGVLLFSSHRWGVFPGTGGFDSVGSGEGEGFTVNVPMPRWREDGDLVALYRRILAPVARSFRPQLILVSAGFDLHHSERLVEMSVTERGFRLLARIVRELAEETCGGRIVLALEGGYKPEALASCVEAVMEELTGARRPGGADPPSTPHGRSVIANARFVYRRYWPALAAGSD